MTVDGGGKLHVVTVVKPLSTMSKIRILRGPNPRRNLPLATARKRGESNFARAFERAYLGEVTQQGLARSDFDLHGYGVADLVLVSWSAAANQQEGTMLGVKRKPRLKVIAFEMKLRDWRKALTQAFRYSYFADQSVVVLPPDAAVTAKNYTAEFRALGVGLWTFDKGKNAIVRVIPPGGGARSVAARAKAITALLGSSQFREFCEAGEAAK